MQINGAGIEGNIDVTWILDGFRFEMGKSKLYLNESESHRILVYMQDTMKCYLKQKKGEKN